MLDNYSTTTTDNSNLNGTITTTSTCGSSILATTNNASVVWADGTSGLYNDSGQWFNIEYPIEQNELEKLSYNIDFGIDKDSILKNHIKGIRKNKIIFNCEYDDDDNIIPYEYIMELIEEKKKFSLKVKVSDLLTICYTNFRFIKIENNLNFGDNCDFSKLKVKFKYDKILHENHKLSEKQIRNRKLKKILKNNE